MLCQWEGGVQATTGFEYWDGMLCQWEGGVQATIGSQFGCSSAS